MTNPAKPAPVRADHDFYVTPAWCVDLIVPAICPIATDAAVLDPCAGDGAIMRALRAHAPEALVEGIELDPVRAAAAGAVCCDALALPAGAWGAPGAVVMNPPFSGAIAFVERATAECAGDVGALMRLGMMAGQRRAAFWREHPADVFVLPRRPSFTGDGRTDGTEYAWFVFGPGRGGRWARL